jgi:hypothetical protein
MARPGPEVVAFQQFRHMLDGEAVRVVRTYYVDPGECLRVRLSPELLERAGATRSYDIAVDSRPRTTLRKATARTTCSLAKPTARDLRFGCVLYSRGGKRLAAINVERNLEGACVNGVWCSVKGELPTLVMSLSQPSAI